MNNKRLWAAVLGVAVVGAGVGGGIALFYKNGQAPQAAVQGQQPHGSGAVDTPGGQSNSSEQQKPDDAFAVRGVIEGFYGHPWTTGQRLEMFNFMADHHFNTYVYAPKDDPYQRTSWGELYPTAKASDMKKLIQAAEGKGVHFVYSISPGIPGELPSKPLTPPMIQNSITISSTVDRARLSSKIGQLRDMGVHTFMLSFDDVKEDLKDLDRAVYGDDYARAHIELANRLYEEQKAKDPDFKLWFAPTKYDGLKDNHYWQTLRQSLNRDIQVIWTGPWIIATSIDGSQADTVANLLGRKPLVWDNFPVNDYTYEVKKRPQLLLGPLQGRSTDLSRHAAGFLANPMIQPEASKVSLATVGAYLNDPQGYQPEQALHAAVAGVSGVEDAASFEYFTQYNRMSYLHDRPDTPVTPLIQAYQQGGGSEAGQRLRAELEKLRDMPTRMRETVQNTELIAEIDPWLTKLGDEAKAGLAALDYLAMDKGDPQRAFAKRNLDTQTVQLRERREWIAEDVLGFAAWAAKR